MQASYFIFITSFAPAKNKLEKAINERITDRINGCTAYREESVIDFVTKSIEAINEEFPGLTQFQVEKEKGHNTDLERRLLFIAPVNPKLHTFKTISIIKMKGYFGEFVTLFEEDDVEMISEFPLVTE